MKASTFVGCMLALLCTFFLASDVSAQGVTTASITGQVTNATGAPIPGAEVSIRNTATGWTGQVATTESGRFRLSSLRPGPYMVSVEIIGYRPETLEEVQLALGETRAFDFVLEDEALELEALAVVGERGANVAGGVSTVVSEDEINRSPTLNREIVDVARFTPQAFVSNEDDDGAAISIAGQNAEYNGLFIDGVVNNDVFGLSAQGTNGGQTGAPPISFDAIEQFQIALSPYDVSQSGFTGGAINAITRSGTNEFTGSAYYQFRNEGLSGNTPGPGFLFEDSERESLPEFSAERYGVRLGGPIVRDKAFFFVSGELFRAETPRPFLSSPYRGDSDPVATSELIRDVLMQEVGYDPGDFRDQASALDDDKLLVKFDWNINERHRLSARHSYSKSSNIDAFGSGGGEINFDNNVEVFPNTTNSTGIEVNSQLGDGITNRLQLGMTFVRDDRGFAGDPFPEVVIEDGSGDFALGSEPFSTGNILNQDIFSITNNLQFYRDQHTFTFGASLEYYDIFNLFIRQNFGAYNYESVDDFLQSVCAAGNGSSSYCQGLGAVDPVEPEDYDRGYSLVDNVLGDDSDAAGAFSAYQIGLYAQDEIQVNDRLRVTAGLRVDIPKITTKPRFSDDVFDTTIPMIEAAGYDLEGATPGETPAAQLYLAPRIGFNYDLDPESATRLRGGAGIFTGRVPFVYPGAMYANNGVTTGFVSRTELGSGDPVPFIPNPENGLTSADFGLPDRPSGELDMFTEDFKYPRVFRTSLGLDRQLDEHTSITVEGQYTNTLDNIIIQNVNFRPQNDQLAGPDNRPVYNYGFNDFFGSFNVNETLIDPRYGNGIYKVGSTSEGHAYDISGTVRRQFGDLLSTQLSYTYGDSYALNDATSDQIASTFQFNENVNGLNFLESARSDWSIGHRILGVVSFEKEFLDRLGTTITAVYQGESGRPYSFIIGGSFGFTGEGSGTSPLAYIPETASQLMFTEFTSGGVTYTAAQQAAAFDAFIDSHDYLQSRRGEYAERNAMRTPFEHVIDLKLSQEIFADIGNRRSSLALTLDIFNFTNLLNSEWGQRYDPGFRTIELLEFEEFVSADDLTPVYTFRFPSFQSADDDPGIQNMDEFWRTELIDFGTYGSRWQMQVGLRYTF